MNRIARWSATTLALIFIAPPLFAQTNSTTTERHIEVSGQGVIQATPDIALLRLTFSVRDKQVERAKILVDNQVDKLLSQLKQLKINDTDIQAAQLTLYPEYDHKNNRQLIGYQVNRDVQIRLRNMLNYPTLLESAAQIGATHSDQLQLDFSNRKALENQALHAAFADAKAQAQLLAEACGAKLGKTLWIHTSSDYGPSPMRMAMMSEMKADASYPTGEIALSRQVQVRFELHN